MERGRKMRGEISRSHSLIDYYRLPSCKRSQVAVFIILAIAIIVLLLILFLRRSEILTGFAPESPVNQIKKCLQDNVKINLDILTNQGGSMEPKNYFLYKGNRIDYICYTNEYGQSCVMQKPFLKKSIEEELRIYSQDKVNECLNSVKKSFEEKGYAVSFKKPDVKIDIIPKTIVINLNNLSLDIEKERKETYSNIKTDLSSDMYDFTMIVSSIANYEARYGDSETMTYMVYYPWLRVEKLKQSDGTNVYIITNKDTQEKFMFAIRSLVLPAGITGE